jgi:cell division protein FtsN/opacity protein-like surface antigen
MNQFLKKALLLCALISSASVFAQKGNYNVEPIMPFQPMFSFGTAYHSFQGDIMGPTANSLLGNMGYRAGMRLNLSEYVDASLLFSNTSLFEKNEDESFKSNVDAIGLHFGYVLNSVFKQSRISPYLTAGLQSLSFKTLNETSQSDWTDRESIIAIPLGLGLRLNISERIDLDATINYTIALGDIDKSEEGNADKFVSANFTIHYDLFTPKPKENIYFDDSYYADVNFKVMDVEDEDSDLVADVDDYCPKTPIGVKVNQFGCPLDTDNDGIPDYIDQEKNTLKGAVVDEKGVQLTDDKYRSMYSDYEAASREYANFYNENEIKRENYKTTDAYLIAKANAFNKAYNNGEVFDNTVKGLKYKVKIGAFSDVVPANVINKYLSLDDLESIPQDDGMVIYAVGTYNSLEDALGREYELEAKGFDDTYILVDNNGSVSNYVIPVSDPVIDEEEVVVLPDVEEVEIEKISEEKSVVSSNETTYRIQIGAFDKELSDKVFEGVDNVVSFSGKDGLVRYMAGSFTEYKEAINYQAQMKARGFEDAFIVTFKNGERISLNVAIKTERTSSKAEVVVGQEIPKSNIEFMVQILVAKESLSAEDLTKMGKLGNIDKEAKGEEMYRYFTGSFTSLEDANIRLSEAKSAGYMDAFIFAKLEGERITIEQAILLLK